MDAVQEAAFRAGAPADVLEAFDGVCVRSATAEGISRATGIDRAGLSGTLARFASGPDEFGRDPLTVRAFGSEGLVAVPLRPHVLNTQGGSRRDRRARVLNEDGEPIPGLFSAGELGGLANAGYQGGTNIAECLVFGRIAGREAAAHARRPR